jgi:hypothetical protein
MSAVVVAINSHANMHQFFDEVLIPADMFSHPVCDLNDAAWRCAVAPACAGNLKPVRAGELELMSCHKAHNLAQATGIRLSAKKCSHKMRLRIFPETLLGNSVSKKPMAALSSQNI